MLQAINFEIMLEVNLFDGRLNAMWRNGLRVGTMAVSVLLVSGCATMGQENPGIAQTNQQMETAEQAKYDQLQMEAERLRSEIEVQKLELDHL